MNRKTWNELRELTSFLGKHKWVYYSSLLSVVVIDSAWSIAIAFIMRDLVDSAIYTDNQLFIRSLYIIIGSMILICLLTPLSHYIMSKSVARVMGNAREELFQKVMTLPAQKLDAYHSGELISRATNNMKAIEEAFNTHFRNLAKALVFGMGSCVVMLVLDWRFAIILITLGVISSYFNGKIAKPMRATADFVQGKLGDLSVISMDIISGIRTVKIFHMDRMLRKKYEETNEQLTVELRKKYKLNSISECINFLLGFSSFGGIIATGAFLFHTNSITFGTIIAQAHLLSGVAFLFNGWGVFVWQIQQSFAGSTRIYELLNEESEPHDLTIGKSENTVDAIRFDDVTFGYSEQRPVIENMTFRIPSGKLVMFVGFSGGGKSSVLKVLSGLYALQKGRIWIHNQKFDSGNFVNIRSCVSYMPQDLFLFSMSIRDNIRLGNVTVGDEEIQRAAEFADVHSFADHLPDGYDTVVGERGGSLSGGQKQRVALARTLLAETDILLLDEPTSALDADTERKIMRTFKNLTAQGKTILVVTHRLSAALDADEIFVVDNGRICEAGSHDELMMQKGIYEQLVRSQTYGDNKQTTADQMIAR